MGKSSTGKEKKVDVNKLENTQKRWLRKMQRIVSRCPKDKYAVAALERGVHPVRKKPRKKIWSSRPIREYAHTLRMIGLNGRMALPTMTRRDPIIDEKIESEPSDDVNT